MWRGDVVEQSAKRQPLGLPQYRFLRLCEARQNSTATFGLRPQQVEVIGVGIGAEVAFKLMRNQRDCAQRRSEFVGRGGGEGAQGTQSALARQRQLRR